MGDRGPAARFSELGGSFLTEPGKLVERLATVRALVFDWDGVFNLGTKGDDASSGFSEADSMGTNMLRYGLWCRDGELPATGIITGENNPSAERFARREHFNAVYPGVTNKARAVAAFCDSHEIERREAACIFDDINDLGMADGCGVRFLVRRRSSPLFEHYVSRENLCDYVTAAEAGGCAVREVAELILGVIGAFDSVVASRAAFDKDYQRYLAERQAVDTQIVTGVGS